jgi:hypothetical protein
VAATFWQRLRICRQAVLCASSRRDLDHVANTAFVRLVLDATGPTVQCLDFGFSDRVRVFVNR